MSSQRPKLGSNYLHIKLGSNYLHTKAATALISVDLPGRSAKAPFQRYYCPVPEFTGVSQDAADVSPAALRAVSSSLRSAASGSGVPASVDVVVTLGAGAGEAAAGSEAMARAQAALATALPQA